jgi:hypothetical protein
VFSVSAVGGGHVTCVSCDACPFLGYMSDRIVQLLCSKIVLRDSGPRMLARVSSIYKRQTRPFVREGPHKKKTVTVKED